MRKEAVGWSIAFLRREFVFSASFDSEIGCMIEVICIREELKVQIGSEGFLTADGLASDI